MSAACRYPWDQQTGESGQEFAQFKSYQLLGSTRSIDKAYRWYVEQLAGPDEVGKRGKRAPGQWQELAVRNRWKERAVAFDCSQVLSAAARIATLWIAGMEILAEKGVKAARIHKPGDKEWGHVLETFKIIAGHLNEESLHAAGKSSGHNSEGHGPDHEPVGVPVSCLHAAPVESHGSIPTGEFVYGDDAGRDDGVT